jgi:hypothetical protein
MRIDRRHRFLVCLPSLVRNGPGPSRDSHDDAFAAIRAAEKLTKAKDLEWSKWANDTLNGWKATDLDGTVRAYVVDAEEARR